MNSHGRTVIVTGGNGYIGSHLCRYLSSLGNRVILIDRDISVKYGAFPREVQLHRIDLSTSKSVQEVSKLLGEVPKNSIVVHLAAEKSVEDSLQDPEYYITNNVISTQNVLTSMTEVGLRRLVFASTAAVYAPTPDATKVNEASNLLILNPYAESKLMSELDIASTRFGDFNFANLRFFNVAGAASRASVEKNGKNLIPEILRAIENNSVFKIFGVDYPTNDGTCVRDFIDVRDLVEAITLTFDLLDLRPLGVLNVGNGVGYSVLEVVRKIQNLDPRLRYEFGDRRVGDHAYVVADSTLAQEILGWKSRYSIDAMIESASS